MDILRERKVAIDRLVAELSGDYDFKSLPELHRAIDDRGVRLIKDNRVIIPSAIYLAQNEKWYILIRNFMLKDFECYALAHEMGHAFLNHRLMSESCAEAEADYFQEQIGYPMDGLTDTLEIVIENLAAIIRNPINVTKYVISDLLKNNYEENLIRRLV